MFKKADIILIVAIVVVTVAISLTLPLFAIQGEKVEIYYNNELYSTVNLSENKTTTVENNGNINVIKIENGKVEVESANCRDQICVNHKKINKTNDSIVCLPNGIVVVVTNG